jgi:hypothetical protein
MQIIVLSGADGDAVNPDVEIKSAPRDSRAMCDQDPDLNQHLGDGF